jgi:signal transduction histidine kinase
VTDGGQPTGSILGSRIGRRFIALFTGCALLPLAIFAWLATSRTTLQMRADLQTSLHNGAKTAGMGVAARLSQVAGDLALARELLQRAGPQGLALVGRSLQRHVGERCAAVWVEAGDATELLCGDQPEPLEPLGDADLQHLKAGKPLVRLVGQPLRLVMIAAADPADPQRERFIAKIRHEWLWDAEELRSPGSECAAYDNHWRPLFHTFRTLPEVEPLLTAASPNGSNASSGTVEWSADGEACLARYWRLFLKPQYGFDMFVVQSRSQRDAFQVIDSFSRSFVLTAVGTLLLVMFASLVQMRRTLQPIMSLHAATQLVRNGDLEARVSLGSSDEFGELGRAFNEMTAELGENVRRRAATERELVSSRDAALAAARAKAEFVTNVSHEFRTPMTAILGAAEILTGDGVDEPIRVEFAAIALQGAKRLAQLVDDVLELGSSTPWELTTTSPEATIVDALAGLPEAVRGRVRLDLAPELPAIEADGPRLAEVWVRLLDNAAKFSPSDSPIDLRARQSDGQLQVTVTDYGVGISRVDYERIFEAFCQVGRDQLTDKASGTGLGLTLVRNAVERHGGRIEVDSELGNGATFRVFLPLSGSPLSGSHPSGSHPSGSSPSGNPVPQLAAVSG